MEEFINDYELLLSSYVKSIDKSQDFSDLGYLIYSELLRIVSIVDMLEQNGISKPLLVEINFDDRLVSLIF